MIKNIRILTDEYLHSSEQNVQLLKALIILTVEFKFKFEFISNPLESWSNSEQIQREKNQN